MLLASLTQTVPLSGVQGGRKQYQHGCVCGNTDVLIVPMPLMLQHLAIDGVTAVGNPIQLHGRDDADGPLIEAPNLILAKGVYFLFFSSNCYTTPQYDVSYATVSSVKGPFTKSSVAFTVKNNSYNITAPGGAQVTGDGSSLVFHEIARPAGACLREPLVSREQM
jgi:hypothetical protein